MEAKMKPVSISQARQVATDHNMTRLLVLGIDGHGNFAFTTYGRTKADCDAMRRWADFYVPGIGVMMDSAT